MIFKFFLENKTGRQEEVRQPVGKNRLMCLFILKDDVFVTRASKFQIQKQIHLPKLLVPLLASFFIHKINAVSNHCYSKYTNCNTRWQGQIFEEITGKTDANDIFTKIIDRFSHEIPGFFSKHCPHDGDPFTKIKLM